MCLPSIEEGRARVSDTSILHQAVHARWPRSNRPSLHATPSWALSTKSDAFRTRWAAHNVRYHDRGTKRLHHPIVGHLTLDFEAMESPPTPA
jgi:MmyB-like transcription regulator ligand binding domain